MKFRLLTKYSMINKWLMAQLGYFSEDMYRWVDGQLSVQPNFFPKVVIVAKCHYSESWQSFSAINIKDARKIIKHKQGSGNRANQILQLFTNKSIDGFDLKITVFTEQLMNTVGSNKVLIPETELFNSHISNPYVLQVETPKGRLFSGGHSQQNVSSYAQGLLQDITTFKLSVGIPVEVNTLVIKEQDFPVFLLTQLRERPLIKIITQLAVEPWSWVDTKQLHLLYWVPLISALLFYLLTNSYFFIQSNYLDSQQAEKREAISTVLMQKNQYDKQRALLVQVSTELSESDSVHYHWHIIEQLFNENMTITRVSFKDDLLVIRGTASKASSVLKAMTTSKYIENISFRGQVRKSRKQDLFTLLIEPRAPVGINVQAQQAPVNTNEGLEE